MRVLHTASRPQICGKSYPINPFSRSHAMRGMMHRLCVPLIGVLGKTGHAELVASLSTARVQSQGL